MKNWNPCFLQCLPLCFFGSHGKGWSKGELFAFHVKREDIFRWYERDSRDGYSLSFIWSTCDDSINDMLMKVLDDVPGPITVTINGGPGSVAAWQCYILIFQGQFEMWHTWGAQWINKLSGYWCSFSATESLLCYIFSSPGKKQPHNYVIYSVYFCVGWTYDAAIRMPFRICTKAWIVEDKIK